MGLALQGACLSEKLTMEVREEGTGCGSDEEMDGKPVNEIIDWEKSMECRPHQLVKPE